MSETNSNNIIKVTEIKVTERGPSVIGDFDFRDAMLRSDIDDPTL